MKIIEGGRQSGKTTQLIQESSAKWLYIVCQSQNEAQRIFDEAAEMKLEIPMPITYRELLEKNNNVTR